MEGYNILIVEDDSIIASSIKRLIESKGAKVYVNATGENVNEQLEDIHLILMDIMLPFDNGIELTKLIRKSDNNIPIIFLSARNDIESKLDGLRNGEDYLTKPFHPLELIARIENILNASYSKTMDYFYDFQIDIISKMVFDDQDNEVELSKTERNLFFYLYQNKNIILEKEKIIDYVWPEGDTYENSLNVYIKKLRDKLNDHDGKIIHTIYGIGYRLNGNEK
ncbi:two-component system response regulator [Macrococcus epidermidis]|uniref:Two-component system response regulator n=1 Tax=Macrococcus epidermidis TaxID=1902580 RepID=A0A327ZXA9_9STAP|nr:response regulator transcription factor [Macrococcus epidermidis]RAK47050.1 two-component system response regulator [Macrococcus epidermidis]UTH15491.1 response regulator transcription factor [Macrococcus epidermidis]